MNIHDERKKKQKWALLSCCSSSFFFFYLRLFFFFWGSTARRDALALFDVFFFFTCLLEIQFLLFVFSFFIDNCGVRHFSFNSCWLLFSFFFFFSLLLMIFYELYFVCNICVFPFLKIFAAFFFSVRFQPFFFFNCKAVTCFFLSKICVRPCRVAFIHVCSANRTLVYSVFSLLSTHTKKKKTFTQSTLEGSLQANGSAQAKSGALLVQCISLTRRRRALASGDDYRTLFLCSFLLYSTGAIQTEIARQHRRSETRLCFTDGLRSRSVGTRFLWHPCTWSFACLSFFLWSCM